MMLRIAGTIAALLMTAGCSRSVSKPWGKSDLYTLRNAKGATATITTYGARVVTLKMPDKAGKFDDIVLGFDNVVRALDGNVPVYPGDTVLVPRADVVYVLRMQHERMRESFVPSLREYAARYQINDSRLRPGQLVMHPGPVNRGVELAASTIDSPQALIGDQVKAGVAVRMAVLYELLVGSPILAAVA